MAAILITGSGVVYFVAHSAATVAYDRSLMDVSLALADQVEITNNQLHLQLPAIAEKVLLVDGYDKLFYEVLDAEGKTVAGNIELPRPTKPFEDGKLYYDGKLNGIAVRVAALSSERNGNSFTVLSAETKLKRDWLVGEIILAMLVPEEEHERVFERFYRLDTTGVDGCGLGLSIVREITHNHNASITIEKGPDLGGALIRVTFPAIN